MSEKKPFRVKTEYPHIELRLGALGQYQPVIEGTGLRVWSLVLNYYKLGMSFEEILSHWDYVTSAQLFSAFSYYHDHREEMDACAEANEQAYRDYLARRGEDNG